MDKKLRAVGEKLERLADKILLFLCVCVFCGLSYYSARYTMIKSTMDIQDNAVLNLAVLAAVTAASILLYAAFRSRPMGLAAQRLLARKRCIVGAATVCVYIISLIWVLNSHVAPGGDGAPLCGVVTRMMYDNYIDMKTGGHMVVFPHQFGLVSVIHLIFKLFGIQNYYVFQHLNALCMPLLFYSGHKILELVCRESAVVIYYILFFLTCLPMFLYVPFVYGEIMSITFTTVLMWQVIRYCKTGKKICFLWGTAAIVFACIVRKNSLIVLIAAGIVLVFHSIRKANLWGILWILVMALSVSGSDRLIRAHYEKLSGIEVAGGVPYISWIRMGLQDSWAGPGWFDNSSIEAFREHDCDTELTYLAEKERLAEILKDLWADKAYSIDFFRRKLLSQWNAPDYAYIDETGQFDCETDELPDIVRRIYYDDTETVLAYMNRYQFVLYFYVAVSAVALFAAGKKDRPLEDHLLYIAIIGGFLFSMMWESSSRYVLPYTIYMLPLAAWGMCRLAKGSVAGVSALGKRLKKEKIPQ